MTEDAKKPVARALLRQRASTHPEVDASQGGDTDETPLAPSSATADLEALKALSAQSGVPGIDLNQICVRLSDLAVLPRELAVRYQLLPVLTRDDRIFVAMAAPTERKLLDEIEFVTGKRVFPYIALAAPLMRAITTTYAMRDRGEEFFVGPRCPVEIQRRAGYSPPESPAASAPYDDGKTFVAGKLGALATPVPNAPVSELQAPVPVSMVPPAVLGVSASDSRLRTRSDKSAEPPQVSTENLRFEADDAPPTPLVAATVERAAGPTRAGVGSRTLLVVDDEADLRQLVRRVFEERGFRVIEAERGSQALAAVAAQMPDVIVLDAMLPEVHGFDIAKRLKGTPRTEHIPIVMVSAVYRGWRFAEDLKASYGVDAYLEKPFRVAELVQAVEDAIAHRTPSHDEDPISADAEKMLNAGIDAYKSGDVTKAVEYLREGTRLDPFAYRLHYHLGLLYGKLGKVYDAIGELQAALDINGHHFPALKNLAVLYQTAGFRNKSIEIWERALGVAPDDPTRQSIKEHLVALL